MKFHSANKGEIVMKRGLYLLTVSVLLLAFSITNGFSQKIPDRPVPPHLVNDFANMLKPDEVNNLERKLVSFNDSTSTQIAVVIVPSLGGYDKSDFAQQLAEKWGIGKKSHNNGILILVKPKTSDSRGEVQIATGYGLEGAIPDITCAEIVDREIIPSFKNGDYYGGLDKGTNTLMALARGEYSAADYDKRAKKGSDSPLPFGLIIFIIIIIIIMSKNSGNSNNKHISTSGLPFWMLLGMMNSGRGSGGSWGGFSGGGGSGGGGGFGGFGGGSFGGGGAGGSW